MGSCRRELLDHVIVLNEELSPAKTPSAPLNLSPFPVVTKNVTSRICDPGEAHANFRDPQRS